MDLGIGGGQKETVIAGPVDRPGAFVLSECIRNNQPIIRGRVEIEVTYLEIELCFASRSVRPFRVLGHETEVSSSRQGCTY